MGVVVNKRGRKPVPCPDKDALRAAYAANPRVLAVGRQFGSKSVKQVRRWLTEAGVELPPQRKFRSRGEIPAWAFVARSAVDGRRITPLLHGAWSNMRRRCASDHPAYYRWYKARGVKCSDVWRDYSKFRAWAVANGYRKGLWLDRVNNDGNYGPDNCRWATRDEQMANRRPRVDNRVRKPRPIKWKPGSKGRVPRWYLEQQKSGPC